MLAVHAVHTVSFIHTDSLQHGERFAVLSLCQMHSLVRLYLLHSLAHVAASGSICCW